MHNSFAKLKILEEQHKMKSYRYLNVSLDPTHKPRAKISSVNY